MENEKVINTLNELIQINNDRMEGYETASKETEEDELKDSFDDFQATSKKCNAELASEVISLGGTPTDGTKLSGKFFRVWMDVKAALTGKDRKTIIHSCEYGEKVAQDTYKNALEDEAEHLSAKQMSMIQGQLILLQEDFDTLKQLDGTKVY